MRSPSGLWWGTKRKRHKSQCGRLGDYAGYGDSGSGADPAHVCSHVTAAPGMDAFCHAMESYVSKATQPVSEGLSYHAMRLIAGALRKAATKGDDIDAREDMLMGSLIAALAFNVGKLGLSHAFAMPLGTISSPHGTVNAIMLPWVMEYNLPAATEKYIEVAKLLGEHVEGLSPMEAAAKSVEAVKRLRCNIGITQGLKDWGVKEEESGGCRRHIKAAIFIPIPEPPG